jgi:PAS domain S-box-containing protein
LTIAGQDLERSWVGLVVHDAGVIVDANYALIRMFRTSAADVLGRGVLDFVVPEDREDIAAAIQMGLHREYEARGLRRDGSVFPIRVETLEIPDGEARLTRCVVMDLEERRAVERADRAREERYRRLVETASDIIFNTDSDGCFTYVNPAATKITGFSSVELIGMHYTDLIREDVRAEARAFYLRQVADQQPVSYYEFPITTADGTERWIGQNLSLLMDSDGGFTAQAVARDITGQREMDRLKDDFVSIVSHELRTPLTSMRAALGLLLTGQLGTLDPKGHRMLEIATQNVERLVRLVNDILDMQKMRSDHVHILKQPVDLNPILEETSSALRSMAESAGVRLSCVTTPGARVLADADRLHQAISNLISNAVKFSMPGTTVRVQSEEVGGEVLIRVSDQGSGIPRDKLLSIFEPFRQADSSDAREKGGTGLGLAIVKAIIEQHGGRVWAESEMGKGSTFTIALPGAPVVEEETTE